MFERNEYTGQWRWTWNNEAWKPQERDFAANDGARGGGRDGGGSGGGGGHGGGGHGGGGGGGHGGGGYGGGGGGGYGGGGGGKGGGGGGDHHGGGPGSGPGGGPDSHHAAASVDSGSTISEEAMKVGEAWANEIDEELVLGWMARSRGAELPNLAEAKSRKVDPTAAQTAKAKAAPADGRSD